MNITDLERAKSTYTGKASDVVRQFAFAGIAVIWLLRVENSTQPIPDGLKLPLILLGLALALDLLQYAISSFIWSTYYRLKLRENLSELTEFREPRWITGPGYFLFVSKILIALAAWICLSKYLAASWTLV